MAVGDYVKFRNTPDGEVVCDEAVTPRTWFSHSTIVEDYFVVTVAFCDPFLSR